MADPGPLHKSSKRNFLQSSESRLHRSSSARVAGIYLIAGFIWIGLSDLAMVGTGGLTEKGFLIAASKGALFVFLSSSLVFWLCRREFRTSFRITTLLNVVVNGTTDAVFVKDRDGRYLLANEAAARILGRPVEDMLGRADNELFEPSDANRLMDNDRAIMAGGEAVTLEEKLNSGGVIRTYHSIKAPYRNTSGDMAGLLGIARDITERKAADEALRESESRFRELSEAIPQIVWEAGPDGTVTSVNANGYEYTGLAAGDLDGWARERVIHPDDLDNAVAQWTRTIEDGVPRPVEFRIRRADGEYRWHICRQRPIRNANGEITSWVGTNTDIDDLKKAENAFRETDSRLREAQRIARLGSWSWEPTTNKVWWSDAEFELFGVDQTSTSASLDTFLSLIHPEDRKVAINRVEAMLAGADEFANDVRIVRPDGSSIWIHSRARATRDAGGVIVRVEGTDQDITAQRFAEVAARESEKRLQAAVEVAGLGIIVVDYERQTAELSSRAAQQFSFAPGVRVARTELHSRFHPDDRAELERLTARALDPAGSGSFDLEHRVVRPDGSTRWLNVRKQVTFENGRPSHAVVVASDVTDRRLAEETLRASEERYRLLFEANPHPMWVYDTDTFRFLAVNDAAILSYGFSREQFLSMTIRDIRPPEDVALLEESVARLKPGLTRPSTWRHRRKNGTVFDVDVTSHDLKDGDGRSRLVLALDITLRLQAEATRDALLSRLRLYLDRMPIAYILFDADIRYADWNPAAEKIFGYTRDEILGQTLHLLVHPADIGHVEAISNRLRKGDVTAQSINRNVTKDGRVITCEWHNTPLFTPDGAFLGVLSMTLDITDRVLANEALRTNEERLREAARVAGFGVFEHDHRVGSFFWSARLREMYGFDPAAPADLDAYLDMIHPEDRDYIAAAVRRAHDPAGDGRFDVEHRLIRPSDGKVLRLSTQSQTRFVGDGAERKPVRTVGATVDVTATREAAQALRDSEERFRRLVTVLPTAVLVHDGERVLYCNPAFVNLVGADSEDEVLARPLFECVLPEDRPLVFARLASMTVSGEPAPGADIRFSRADGRPVPTHGISTPITGYGPSAFLVALTDLTERERATTLLRSVLDSVGDAILTINSRGIVSSANQATQRLFGYAETELVDGNVSVLMPEPHRGDHDRYLSDYLRTGVARVIGVGREVEGRRKNGTLFPAELTVTEFLRDGERQFTGVIRDITARRQLEEQFRQAQKMEAVGRLAGGVAHDFNNLLTVINGYSDMLLADLHGEDPSREPLAAIQDAGERAARLTQQLLAFSRKSVVEPRMVDLNELVDESAKLLRRLIGEDVALAFLADPGSVRLVIDPGQLEQVLMNLAVNARDAMPKGGLLTIETHAVELGIGGDRNHPDLSPGRYVSLRVSDTGCGMTEEVRDKIFEPFFTTKGLGKGTGLGLAVVHGVVKQAGGSVTVESKVGAGTTFTILLPAATGAAGGPDSGVTRLAPRGIETVLVVEDEDAVRTLVRVALEGLGYTVLPASNGEKALDLLKAFPERVDLLVTDVIMPGMSGRDLAESARQARPGLRVLYMSGYTDDALDRHGLQGAAERFIQKPFTPLGLARKVREILDQSE